MDVQALIGFNVNRLRVGKGLSQEELAHRCELVHQEYISALESGKRNPSSVTLALLANALNTQIAELFSVETAPQKIISGPLIVKSTRSGIKNLPIELSVFRNR